MLGPDGMGVLEPLGVVVDASVDMGVVDAMVGLLAAATDETDVAVPSPDEMALAPPPPEAEDQAEGHVNVLGPVEVT